MSYVIYHRETTYYMPGMKRGGYANKAAATRALNKAAKKTAADHEIAKYFDDTYITLAGDYRAALDATMKKFGIAKSWNVPTNRHITERSLVDAADYEIAEAVDFHDNIEKMVTRVNLMSQQKYQERANTPSYCSPACESYWSM